MLLQILNGDATRGIFEKSGLPGQPLSWRDMLSEGMTPAGCDIGRFFEKRAAHLQSAYGIPRESYLADTAQTRKILQQASQYEEIVLWFEFDLFCQINLVFLIQYLLRLNTPMPRVSVVQPGSHPDVADFRGMGMLQPAHMPPLFEKRAYLEAADWQLASATWEAYTSNNPLALEALTGRAAPNLPFLGSALLAHLRRLPSAESGLNSQEHFFLEQLSAGSVTEHRLYERFWKEKKIYGFGDFQLAAVLSRMTGAGVIARTGETLEITDTGRQVLGGEADYLALADFSNAWLGGLPLHNTPWRWNTLEGKVMRV